MKGLLTRRRQREARNLMADCRDKVICIESQLRVQKRERGLPVAPDESVLPESLVRSLNNLDLRLKDSALDPGELQALKDMRRLLTQEMVRLEMLSYDRRRTHNPRSILRRRSTD